ncbi:MAG: four helix bundle protein [Clostridiales bacterium]|jgi:four helix bundle protein|nr:four helix bundle protein [Clostridiales bacterium]
MDKDIIKNKSFDFAVRIVNLCEHAKENKIAFVLVDQLLKSGTSIGANVREARNAASRKDFVNKLNVALKEADETEYWLELFFRTNKINEAEYESIINDCRELIYILTAIVKNTKNIEN